jgi:dihydrofolate synthase/folylpolyglutamate synthase
MSRFNSIDEVWAFLDSIPMFQKTGNSAANFSLDNIRAFCEALGNSHDKYPSIHVAGTNGKGTTSYLLENIYTEAGYKTGLFTSPHLLRYHERVRAGQKEISDEKLLEFFREAETIFDSITLSYFEISTALAFWYFADQKVDIAIIETGLGGRLDSTNIITPEVSVITSIGRDHQAVLGDTLDEIAAEKAGIIKQGKPVVIGNIAGSPQQVIEKTAEEKRSSIFRSSSINPEWNSGIITLNNGEIKIKTLFRESINKWNVAMCHLATEVLKQQFPISKDEFITAVKKFKGAPGRFEKIHPDFDWYFSGSHNAQALESSIEGVQAIKSISESVLIFSAMKDKLNNEMMEHFKGFKKAYFVEQEGERAAKFSDVKDAIDVELMEESRKEIILNELKTELVIFMGSFYFYPIVKRWTANVSI